MAGASVTGDTTSPATAVSLFGLPCWINAEGERFVNETCHYSERCKVAAQQTNHFCWGVTDSSNPYVETLEATIAEGGVQVYKADTLEELAEMIGVPVDTFLATVEKYNADYAAGNGDTVYGMPESDMIPLLLAPFYAQRVQPLNMFCMVSLKVDDNCHVLNSKGEAVPNLYGVGEVAVGNCFFESYACSGSAIMIALSTGKIAALDAIANMQ